MNTDRIEKKIFLRATRERVWNAISEADQFGAWFGVAFDGLFAKGARLTGRKDGFKVVSKRPFVDRSAHRGHKHLPPGGRQASANT
jgi:uncharacterized protein YndB with AHSA1/START domain